MGARTARIGFIGYAVAQVAFTGLGVWSSFLMGSFGHDRSSGLEWQLKIVNAGYLSLEVLAVVALVLMSRVPQVTRARPLAILAAITAGVAVLVGFGERLVFDRHLV